MKSFYLALWLLATGIVCLVLGFTRDSGVTAVIGIWNAICGAACVAGAFQDLVEE